MAAVFVGIMWSFMGGQDNTWISPMLASLFIVWSIAQAASFKTGMVEWLANGLGDAKLHTYREKASTASQFVIELLTSGLDDNNKFKLHLIKSIPYFRYLIMGSVLLLIMRYRPGGIIPEKVRHS